MKKFFLYTNFRCSFLKSPVTARDRRIVDDLQPLKIRNFFAAPSVPIFSKPDPCTLDWNSCARTEAKGFFLPRKVTPRHVTNPIRAKRLSARHVIRRERLRIFHPKSAVLIQSPSRRITT